MGLGKSAFNCVCHCLAPLLCAPREWRQTVWSAILCCFQLQDILSMLPYVEKKKCFPLQTFFFFCLKLSAMQYFAHHISFLGRLVLTCLNLVTVPVGPLRGTWVQNSNAIFIYYKSFAVVCPRHMQSPLMSGLAVGQTQPHNKAIHRSVQQEVRQPSNPGPSGRV